MSKQEQFLSVIRELRENVPEITGVMVATVDGLSIATDFPPDEGARVAAMGASSIGLGNRMTKVTDVGTMQDMLIEGDNGIIVIYMAGNGGILALRAPRGANLGLIRLDGPVAAEKVAKIMSG